MIVFELICSDEHRFEGWFASGDEFERQRLAGMVACPMCSNTSVAKLPSARIRRTDQRGGSEQPGAVAGHGKPAGPKHIRTTLAGFIDQILQNTEDVGAAFPDEARKIHYEEAPRRGIRGTASREEAEALAEEGIPVLSVPIPPADDWH